MRWVFRRLFRRFRRRFGGRFVRKGLLGRLFRRSFRWFTRGCQGRSGTWFLGRRIGLVRGSERRRSRLGVGWLVGGGKECGVGGGVGRGRDDDPGDHLGRTRCGGVSCIDKTSYFVVCCLFTFNGGDEI